LRSGIPNGIDTGVSDRTLTLTSLIAGKLDVASLLSTERFNIMESYLQSLADEKGLLLYLDAENERGDIYAVKIVGRMLIDGKPENFAAQYFVSQAGAASFLRTWQPLGY